MSFYDPAGRAALTSATLPEWQELLAAPHQAQVLAGYADTLCEIRQQPLMWSLTARQIADGAEELRPALDGCHALALTGSGSSEYAGACAVLPLRDELGIPVEAVPGGLILTHGSRALLPGRPAMLVSLARSGESPESCAAVELLLETDPAVRHLVITCNRGGRLARIAQDAGATVITLDERTNDRSLVMTSSFTSMALASRFLGLLDRPADCIGIAENLGRAAGQIFSRHTDALRAAALSGFNKAVFLGTGTGAAVARETALKMLEMNAGRVAVMPESFLGLRHGPLALIDSRTLVVAFLSSDPVSRAYELDVLSEVAQKHPEAHQVVVCGEPPEGLKTGAILDCPGLAEAGDANAPAVYALAGQLLAFFRCLAEGLRPDSPSDGAINRVVGSFTIHRQLR